nr:ABC transporter substrate-binding protein [Bradyrhizobium genosp. SA-3]
MSNLRGIPPAAEGGAVYDTIFGVLTHAAIFLVLLERHDHPRQPGSSRRHHHSGRKRLGEDKDWLRDIAIEMEIEDGLIWFYGVSEDGVQAFAATTGRAVLEAGGKSKFFVQANYAFGASVLEDARSVISAAGGKILGTVKSDYASFLLQAQSSGAEVIGFASASADSSNLIKQA